MLVIVILGGGFCKQGFSESWKCVLGSCTNLLLVITKPGFSHPGEVFFRSRENHCFQHPCQGNPREGRGTRANAARCPAFLFLVFLVYFLWDLMFMFNVVPISYLMLISCNFHLFIAPKFLLDRAPRGAQTGSKYPD